MNGFMELIACINPRGTNLKQYRYMLVNTNDVTSIEPLPSDQGHEGDVFWAIATVRPGIFEAKSSLGDKSHSNVSWYVPITTSVPMMDTNLKPTGETE
jgi:hypothetical protein